MGPLENATFYQGQLTGSAATLATVPAGEDWVIDDVILCNTDSSSAVTITLNLVPSGGSVAAANELLSVFSVAESTTTSLAATLGKLGIVIEPGVTINGLASIASKMNVWVTGRTRQH